MANSITQKPLYTIIPVGSDIIFTISNGTIVGSYFNVKFIAEVYISHTTPPDITTTTDLIGTFKAAPNNAGVGMFDFSAVVENHVKSDNLSARNSEYKQFPYSSAPFPAATKFSLALFTTSLP